jgi:AbrB family looped-hinge helix DNA binding protein
MSFTLQPAFCAIALNASARFGDYLMLRIPGSVKLPSTTNAAMTVLLWLRWLLRTTPPHSTTRSMVLQFLHGNTFLERRMDTSSVTSKGQVTIPKQIRRELGIRQGSRIAFAVKNGKAELRVLHRAPARTGSGFGMLKVRRRHLAPDFDVAALLAPRRRSRR